MSDKTTTRKSQHSEKMDKKQSEYSSVLKKLSEEERAFIKKFTPVKKFKKGTILLKEGQISDTCYFNFKGCVRQYYLVDGIEKTTFFYTENQAITSFESYTNRTPSKHYLECIEDCELSVTNRETEKEMYNRFPHFEALCRMEAEKALGEYQEALAKFITTSPEERYVNLVQNRPDLLNRVPQHQLASYLGVKPESLSRIRKRIAQKTGNKQ